MEPPCEEVVLAVACELPNLALGNAIGEQMLPPLHYMYACKRRRACCRRSHRRRLVVVRRI
jgi:hypothetical protein